MTNYLWLGGAVTFTVDGKPNNIGPGQACFIPRGPVHGFNNLKPANAKVLAVVTPALIGSEFFREMAVIINAGGPPYMERMKAVMAKHGLFPVLPKNESR